MECLSKLWGGNYFKNSIYCMVDDLENIFEKKPPLVKVGMNSHVES